MKYIIYSHNDNRLGVIYPINTADVNEIAQSVLPTNTDYAIVETLNLVPFFFDAYEYSNKSIRLNVQKAKNIWKNVWRQKRAEIFERLDIEFMKAVEDGNIQQLQNIKSKKQLLRDVTNTELPNTVEEMQQIWPNILNS